MSFELRFQAEADTYDENKLKNIFRFFESEFDDQIVGKLKNNSKLIGIHAFKLAYIYYRKKSEKNIAIWTCIDKYNILHNNFKKFKNKKSTSSKRTYNTMYSILGLLVYLNSTENSNVCFDFKIHGYDKVRKNVKYDFLATCFVIGYLFRNNLKANISKDIPFDIPEELKFKKPGEYQIFENEDYKITNVPDEVLLETVSQNCIVNYEPTYSNTYYYDNYYSKIEDFHTEEILTENFGDKIFNAVNFN